jgi:AcrR family transcriptional regulator
VLVAAETEPAAARVFLIEALAAGSDVREKHERLLAALGRAIDRELDRHGEGVPRVQIPGRALLGGIANVVAVRVFAGETGRLTSLLDDLLAWIDSYAIPESARRLDAAAWAELGEGLEAPPAPPVPGDPETRLPRGHGSLPAGEVADEHRNRIIGAMARLAREKGYTAMTVADLVAAASVTRESFYELFRNKEEAFLAAQAYGLQTSVALTAGSFFGAESWPDRAWNGSEALLGYVGGQLDLVHVDLVESYAAGPAAIRRSFDNRMAYTLFLEDAYRISPEAERLPRLCSEAIGGANLELMRSQVVAGRTERMLEVLPQMAFVTLAPFLGAPRALRLVEEKVADLRRRVASGHFGARRA